MKLDQPMRTDRLFEIIETLRDGHRHRACDLAQTFGVSIRTIYRDMERIIASGVPVEGTRGSGYQVTQALTLPPLMLSPDELEVLQLGIAIVSEASDEGLRQAAGTLGDKIDDMLGTRAIPQADAWKFAFSPFSNAARGYRHLATLRAAIKARQKLRTTYTSHLGEVANHIIRPLQIEQWARVWTLVGWCEQHEKFEVFRLDLMETAEALPELFVDEPGRTLNDYQSDGSLMRQPV